MRKFLYVTPLFLLGCGSLNPLTLLELSRFSPLEADPADIAIRADLPPGLGVVPDSGRLVMEAANPARGWLAQESTPITMSGEDSLVFEIAPQHQDGFRTVQARIREWEAADSAGTEGSLSATFTFCRENAGPAADSTLSVEIRTRAGGAFLPLMSNVPLSALPEPMGIATLEPCPGT